MIQLSPTLVWIRQQTPLTGTQYHTQLLGVLKKVNLFLLNSIPGPQIRECNWFFFISQPKHIERSHRDGSFEHPKHMFKVMDKKIIAILHKLFFLNWPYGIQTSCLNPFLASGNFCRLLITFANSLNPDQDRHNVKEKFFHQCMSGLIWVQNVCKGYQQKTLDLVCKEWNSSWYIF